MRDTMKPTSISDLKTSSKVRCLPPPDNSAIISSLEELLERAKNGEIIGLTICLELTEGCYSISGTKNSNRREMVGTLLEMAIKRAGFAEQSAVERLTEAII